MKRKELQELSVLRLKEASLLLKSGCPDGAYYLGGYAAECAVKACIAKTTSRHEFPDKEKAVDSWSHDFGKLIKWAGFQDELRQAEKQNSDLSANWTSVRKWKPESRYRKIERAEAEDLLRALKDPKQGVISWLKLRW